MVKHIERRAFAFLLALVMIFSLVPVHAFAASTVNVLDGKVSVSDADSVTDDGVVTLSQEPTYDSCGGTYSSASKTVTITNKTTNKAVVSFTYTKVSNVEGDPTVKGATINGSTVTATLAAGGTFTFTFATRAAEGAAVVKLSDFSIVEEKILKATFMVAANGGYTVNGTAVTAETTIDVKSTDAIALAATPASGYAFAGWYNVTTGKALSFKQSASINLSANTTITPLFVSNADAVWAIEEARFTTLDEALTAAAGAPGSAIRPLKDVTLTKNYTIPAGITLLVPYNDAGTCLTEMTTNYTSPTDAGPAAPKVYRTLTLADGVTLTVNGQLSVSALHYPATGSKAWGGRVDGNYGLLKLNGSSKVIVGSGASMYAFGYVLGTGSVEALSGATVYENMQMVEFIGGSNLLSGLSKHQYNKFFLFSQYYVQNIESALKINSGAALKTFATMSMSGETKAMPITFIGAGGMFALASGSYAVKKYDAASDRLAIDAYGDISVSSINMTMTGVPLLGSVTISSSDFYLPVNANITVNINSGTAMIYQSLTLLPGARINVAKGAQVYVPQGTQVNLYDQAEWGNYVFSGKKVQPLTYIGSTGKASTRTINGDAILDINGVLGNAGKIYTSASGAQIISSKGNGIYIHMADAPTAAVQIAGRLNGGTENTDWDKKTFNPAWLLNNDGTFVETINSKANTGYIFNPLTGKWEANATVALHPNGATGEVVKFQVPVAAIAANQGNSAALPDAATAGFNMTGGEFLGWNTKPDGTGTSYAAGTTLTVTGSINLYAQWKITGHTITFLNEDGSVFKEITVNEGATPDPEGFPSKAADLQYTYTFAGWDRLVDGKYDGVADTVAVATGPATYKAIFSKTVNTYDVVFYDEDGTTVLYTAENVPYGTVPAYEGTVPTKAGNAQFTYTFAGWSATKGGAAAAVPAVDGTNLAYYAIYTSETNKYTVTWTNENGDLIDSDEVAYGTVPTAPVAPSKASDAANHYAFAGWDANNDGKVDEIVAVTGTVTYKAVFTAEAHKYTVNYEWINNDGSKCVATGKCACDHVATANATITSEITKKADCGVEGETTYTAKFVETWAETQTLTLKNIPARQHAWSDPSYTWTGESCSATRVCGHDAAHKQTETVVASKDTVAGTCKTPEVVTYTAEFTAEWAKTQEKTVTGQTDPNNHESNEITYKNITEETHDEYHACCDTPSATLVPHNYVNGICACQAKQSFVITWTVNGAEYTKSTHKFGAAITAPAYDVPEGHTFSGWDVPATMPAKDITLDATLAPNEYEVYVNDANGEIIDTWVAPYGDVITAEDLPVCELEGHTHVGWRLNGVVIELPVTVTGTMFFNPLLKLNNYTITWTVNGEEYTKTTRAYGAAITAPAYDVPEGHTFSGWDVPATMPAKDITLDATLTVNTYTITWIVNGEEYTKTTHEYGTAITAPVYDVPEGHTFFGWDVPATMPAKDITLEAKLSVNEYSIYWDWAGLANSWTYGEEFSMAEPAREGYTFTGWKYYRADITDAMNGNVVKYEEYTGKTMPAFDLYAEAQWKPNTYTLTVLATDISGDADPMSCPLEVTVPYGALLKDYIPENCGGEYAYAPVYMPGDTITVSGAFYDGTFTIGAWCDLADWNALDLETATMPADDMTIFNSYLFTGWCADYWDGPADEWVDTALGVEYVVDSIPLEGWQQIDGNWYYFAYNRRQDRYFRVEGVSRVPYPTEPINGTTYAPNAEDVAYYENKGETFIDKETGLFVFDEDGKFQFSQTGKDGDRWIEKGYIPWHVGMVKIDGEYSSSYYYFVGDTANGGNILASSVAGIVPNETGSYDIYVTRANHSSLDRQFNPGYYTFNSRSYMVQFTGACNYGKWDSEAMSYTKLRYYGSQGADKHRLMKGLGLYGISGRYIYVNTDGEMIRNAEYWVPENNYGIEPGMYWFDKYGYLVMPEPEVVKDGIYFENGAWYYYEEGHKGYNKGLIFTSKHWFNEEGNDIWGEGATIYVRSDACLATGAYYVTNLSNYAGSREVNSGDKLLFNEMGMLMSSKNGIVAENGSLYYYVNNKLAYAAGLIVIDGNYYYVTTSGEVVNNRNYWITNVNNTGVVAKSYYFDENGVMQNPQINAKNGIVEEDGVLYYYINNSKAYAAGVVKIAENTYIYVRTAGNLAIGQYWVTNTNGLLEQGMYDFGADGYLIVE